MWPKDHRRLCHKVGSLSLANCLVGSEPGTFQFWLQRLNPLYLSLSPSCLWIPKCSFKGSYQNLPVKRNIQPFWSKHFTALTVDLTAIYMPWYACKLTNILDLAFWVNHLFWEFSFHVLRYGRNWRIQENLLSFSLICGFGKAWFSFDAFPNFLHWLSQKTRLTFDIWLFDRLLLYQKFGEF